MASLATWEALFHTNCAAEPVGSRYSEGYHFGMDEIRSDPKILGGTPCFTGTRVPAASLFDHLRLGYTVAAFLEQFPSVSREQVDAVLNQARDSMPQFARRVAG